MRYSVIIPFKDEEENIEPLVQELEPIMQALGESWELIAIDDGSTDNTLAILQNLSTKKSYLRLIPFSRNFGQSHAFAAGFDLAKGSTLITLDGDGQNDPKDIPNLLKAFKGCDMVCGWRKERRDPWLKKAISRPSNFIRSRVCQDRMHDSGCSLKVYRATSAKQIKMYRGMHRFLPALFVIEGFTVKEEVVSHRARKRGKTKYHVFNRLIGPITDLFVVAWMRRRKVNYTLQKGCEWI